MAIRIPWDKYEVALLLEYCIKIENKELSRAEAVSMVSQILRRRAICNGIEIDEVFRNENGISMQLSAMKNCYLGKKQGLTISKLFYDIVALQKDNPDEFHHLLLEETGKMDTTIWQKFLQWLSYKYPNKDKQIQHSLMLVNATAHKKRIMGKSLFDISSPEEIKDLQKVVNSFSLLGFQSKKNANEAYYALQLYLDYLQKKMALIPERIEQKEQVVINNTSGSDDNCFIVDFHVVQSYTHTKPVSCRYKGTPIKLSGWNAIFHALVQAIYKDYKDVFPVGQSLSSSTRIDTGTAEGMIYPKEIADGIFLDCNVSSTGVINKLRSLMDICCIDYADIQIKYRFTEKGLEGMSPTVKETKSQWKPKYTEEITKIISTKFKYGFRIGSAIETMKLRNYAELMNLELPEADERLEKEINAAGVTIDGKVYVFCEELLNSLGSIIDEIFKTGAIVVFLKAFIENHEEWLEEIHIASESLLKEALKQCRPSWYFGQNIITQGKRMTEHEAVVSEIHRVASSEAVVRVSNLAEKLRYIPCEKIAWSLSASDEFVWMSEGKYFCMWHFIQNKEDEERIQSFE